MTTAWITGRTGTLDLQATLSSVSAGGDQVDAVLPHHPITCYGGLRFEADGTLACEHTETPLGDLRTMHCVNHSLAVLLMELAHEL